MIFQQDASNKCRQSQQKVFVHLLGDPDFIVFLMFFPDVSKYIQFNSSPPPFIPLPTAAALRNTDLSSCPYPILSPNSTDLQCKHQYGANNQIVALARGLTKWNQILMVELLFKAVDLKISIDIQQNVQIDVYELTVNQISNGSFDLSVGQLLRNQTTQFVFSSADDPPPYKSEVDGISQVGFQKIIGYLPQLKVENYLLVFNFESLPFKNVFDLQAMPITINIKWSQFGLALRYCCFVVSLITSAIYLLHYRMIKNPLMQQQLISVLSVLTVLFNDPLSALTLLAPNPFSSALSMILFISLLGFLPFFWLTLFHRLLVSQQTINPSHLIGIGKKIYLACLLLSLLFLQGLFLLQRMQERPLYPTEWFMKGSFLGVGITAAIILLSGMLTAFVLFFKCLCKYSELMYRNRLLLAFSALFMLLIIGLFFFSGFNSSSYVPTVMLLTYIMLNTHTIYLQYMYSRPFQSFCDLFSCQRTQDHFNQESRSMPGEWKSQIEKLNTNAFQEPEEISNIQFNQKQQTSSFAPMQQEFSIIDG